MGYGLGVIDMGTVTGAYRAADVGAVLMQFMDVRGRRLVSTSFSWSPLYKAAE